MKARRARRRAKRLHILTNGKRPDVLIGLDNAVYACEPERDRLHIRCDNPFCMLFRYHDGQCLLRESTVGSNVGSYQEVDA